MHKKRVAVSQTVSHEMWTHHLKKSLELIAMTANRHLVDHIALTHCLLFLNVAPKSVEAKMRWDDPHSPLSSTLETYFNTATDSGSPLYKFMFQQVKQFFQVGSNDGVAFLNHNVFQGLSAFEMPLDVTKHICKKLTSLIGSETTLSLRTATYDLVQVFTYSTNAKLEFERLMQGNTSVLFVKAKSKQQLEKDLMPIRTNYRSIIVGLEGHETLTVFYFQKEEESGLDSLVDSLHSRITVAGKTVTQLGLWTEWCQQESLENIMQLCGVKLPFFSLHLGKAFPFQWENFEQGLRHARHQLNKQNDILSDAMSNLLQLNIHALKNRNDESRSIGYERLTGLLNDINVLLSQSHNRNKQAQAFQVAYEGLIRYLDFAKLYNGSFLNQEFQMQFAQDSIGLSNKTFFRQSGLNAFSSGLEASRECFSSPTIWYAEDCYFMAKDYLETTTDPQYLKQIQRTDESRYIFPKQGKSPDIIVCDFVPNVSSSDNTYPHEPEKFIKSAKIWIIDITILPPKSHKIRSFLEQLAPDQVAILYSSSHKFWEFGADKFSSGLIHVFGNNKCARDITSRLSQYNVSEKNVAYQVLCHTLRTAAPSVNRYVETLIQVAKSVAQKGNLEQNSVDKRHEITMFYPPETPFLVIGLLSSEDQRMGLSNGISIGTLMTGINFFLNRRGVEIASRLSFGFNTSNMTVISDKKIRLSVGLMDEEGQNILASLLSQLNLESLESAIQNVYNGSPLKRSAEGAFLTNFRQSFDLEENGSALQNEPFPDPDANRESDMSDAAMWW